MKIKITPNYVTVKKIILITMTVFLFYYCSEATDKIIF